MPNSRKCSINSYLQIYQQVPYVYREMGVIMMRGKATEATTVITPGHVGMSPERALRPQLILLRHIGKHGETGVHLAVLQREMNKSMSRTTLIKSLASLEHLGMIRGEWIRTNDRGVWKRRYFVSGEGTELFLKKLEALFK